MTRQRTRTVLVLCMTFMMLLSLPATAMAGAVEVADESDGQPSIDTTNVTDEQVNAADTVYVTEEGDAVLQYGGPGTHDRGQYGFDATDRLVYGFLEGDASVDEQVDAEMTAELEPDRLVGDGFLSVPAPDELRKFEVGAEAEQSADTARAHAELYAEFSEEDETLSRELGDLSTTTDRERLTEAIETSETVTTEGTVVATTDRVESTGVTTATDGFVSENEFFDVKLTGQDGSYTLDVTEDRVLYDWNADSWDTEANATETIKQDFNDFERNLGATVVVDVTHHSFDETTQELEIQYTVDIVGIEQNLLSEELAASEDLTAAQADNLADAMLGVNVDTVRMTIDADATTDSVESAWTVDVRNLEPVAEVGFDIAEAEAVNDDEADAIAEARDRFDAASMTEYTHLGEWDILLTETTDSATVDAVASYDTENREAYVEMLQEREVIEEPAELEFELAGELTPEDRVDTTASLTVEREDLVEGALDSAITYIRANDDADADLADLAELVRNADMEKAKLDASLRDSEVTVEAGGQFEDVSELSEVLANEFAGESVGHLYAEFDEDASTGTVEINGLIDGEISESAVRDTPIADADTEIVLPGEWNPDNTDFARLDIDRAADFLDVETEDEHDGEQGPATIELEPAEQTAVAGDEVTYDIVLTNLTNGLSSYDVTVAVSDTDLATITNASVERESGFGDEVIAEDGSSVQLERALGDDTYEAADEIRLGDVTIEAASEINDGPTEVGGTVDVTIQDALLSDLDNEEYEWTAADATLEVLDELPAPDVTGDGQPATDTNGDGKLNDIDGSGEFGITDVQLLFENRNEEAIRDNAEQFDFADTGDVGIADVQALFEQLQQESA